MLHNGIHTPELGDDLVMYNIHENGGREGYRGGCPPMTDPHPTLLNFQRLIYFHYFMLHKLHRGIFYEMTSWRWVNAATAMPHSGEGKCTITYSKIVPT